MSLSLRKDIDDAGIPSWFLTQYARKEKLEKMAPGFYALSTWNYDEYFVFQYRYPKFIFSCLTALYLNGLTDRVPDVIEATAPSGYHPYKQKEKHFVGRFLRNHSIYMVGTTTIKTMYDHPVLAYGMERAICELVKERDSYDPETFLKALNRYVERKDADSQKLYEIADTLKVSKQVREIMEIVRF